MHGKVFAGDKTCCTIRVAGGRVRVDVVATGFESEDHADLTLYKAAQHLCKVGDSRALAPLVKETGRLFRTSQLLDGVLSKYSTDSSIVQALLQCAGLKIEADTFEFAIRTHDSPVVQSLVAYKADLAPVLGGVPCGGNYDTVKCLIEAKGSATGFLKHITGERGGSRFSGTDGSCVQYLLEQKADPNAGWHDYGMKFDIVTQLLGAGADATKAHILHGMDAPVTRVLLDAKACPDEFFKKRQSGPSVQMLLDAGADAEQALCCGQTYPDTVRRLLAAKANPDDGLCITQDSETTALLLQAGGDPNIGMCTHPRAEQAEQLLSAKADPTVRFEKVLQGKCLNYRDIYVRFAHGAAVTPKHLAIVLGRKRETSPENPYCWDSTLYRRESNFFAYAGPVSAVLNAITQTRRRTARLFLLIGARKHLAPCVTRHIVHLSTAREIDPSTLLRVKTLASEAKNIFGTDTLTERLAKEEKVQTKEEKEEQTKEAEAKK